MDVELRHLRALIAVAEELNFTRAARRLHLTQQALSGQIRQLEQRVGTRLVDRDTHHVQLTPAGAALYERCRSLLAGAERAVAAARAAGSQAPRLVLGYPAPLTHRIAAPTIELFTARHPDVEVTIHFGGLFDPSAGLRERACDVAIVYGVFDGEGLELRHLFGEPRGIALAAGHPLARKKAVTLAELVAEPIVDVPSTDEVYRGFWIAGKHRGGKPPVVGATVQTLDGLIEAIGAGLGVATTIARVVDAMGATAGVVFPSSTSNHSTSGWRAGPTTTGSRCSTSWTPRSTLSAELPLRRADPRSCRGRSRSRVSRSGWSHQVMPPICEAARRPLVGGGVPRVLGTRARGHAGEPPDAAPRPRRVPRFAARSG